MLCRYSFSRPTLTNESHTHYYLTLSEIPKDGIQISVQILVLFLVIHFLTLHVVVVVVIAVVELPENVLSIHQDFHIVIFFYCFSLLRVLIFL